MCIFCDIFVLKMDSSLVSTFLRVHNIIHGHIVLNPLEPRGETLYCTNNKNPKRNSSECILCRQLLWAAFIFFYQLLGNSICTIFKNSF